MVPGRVPGPSRLQESERRSEVRLATYMYGRRSRQENSRMFCAASAFRCKANGFFDPLGEKDSTLQFAKANGSRPSR